jgi:hypothetical protein
MSETWFCNKCHKVWSGPKECCGLVEKFELLNHGDRLIPMANSFLQIQKHWENDEYFKRVSDELTLHGCFGWATIFNEFVERLKEGRNE